MYIEDLAMSIKKTSPTISEKAPSNAEQVIEPEQQPRLQASKVQTRTITGIKWALLVAGVLSSVFLFSLDMSIVADIQPRIINTFGEIDKLPWLSVAFALGGVATSLIWASIYTSFDAKWNYINAVILFEIGSAICGAANMMDILIFGRALAGIGGAGMYVGVLTLLSTLTNASERPLYIASVGLLWGAGSVLGSVSPIDSH
jgi:MFS family permease